MPNALKEHLEKEGYTSVKLKLTKTNHFKIKATINGIKGTFILDTGASNSFIGNDYIDVFKLKVKESDTKATGAGATDMETLISKKNSLKIGKWKQKKTVLVLISLDHINTAFVNNNLEKVHGIIGADVLKKTKAIIDYNKKYLYLKH